MAHPQPYYDAFDTIKRHSRGEKKAAEVMGEFKRGTLRDGQGETVTDHEQAIAIALSEGGAPRKHPRH